MSNGDVNIDDQDLKMAQGAFTDDDDPQQFVSEYEEWLEMTYTNDRKKRAVDQKKVRF
jgi:hypothetical protein